MKQVTILRGTGSHLEIKTDLGKHESIIVDPSNSMAYRDKVLKASIGNASIAGVTENAATRPHDQDVPQ